MYAILKENICLRSYWLVPYCFFRQGDEIAGGLSEKEFNLLKKCDGNTQIRKSKLFEELVTRELVRTCNKGETLSDWQKYRNCDNRYMPKMNIQLTGKCNYNCIHCFNAKDNAPLQSQLSFENVIKILDDCVECGVQALTITGGEPMLHPQYKEIIEEIYKRGLTVFELNTNGFFINQEMLDWMKSLNYKPLVKISFDGINGNHNWMRGNPSAEEKTLKVIKLCVDNGFKVKIQMNLNKKNFDSIVPSCDLLDKMGVDEVRLIKTTEAPRWEQNGKGFTMDIREYLDAAYTIAKEYFAVPRHTVLNAWLIYYANYETQSAYLQPYTCLHKSEYRDSLPLCKGVRGMIAVGSNGNVYPCLQSSGYFEEYKMYYGNIVKDGLKKLLQDSSYMKLVTTTVKEKLNPESKCLNCKHFIHCAGGCPAMSLLYRGNYLLEDPTRCVFFNENYDQKYKELFKNLGFGLDE